MRNFKGGNVQKQINVLLREMPSIGKQREVTGLAHVPSDTS